MLNLNIIVMDRDELIKLCQDAVVHHSKWCDRDSYSAQRGIQSIYRGLTAGLEFKILTKDISPDYYSNDRTIIIEFIQPIDFKKLANGEYLEISSIEEYFEECDPEHFTEMFNGSGIDFHSSFTCSYMPTRERLIACDGLDWY